MSGDDSSLSLRAPARETVFRPFPLASSSGALYIERMFFRRRCINQSVHYLRLYRSLYSNKYIGASDAAKEAIWVRSFYARILYGKILYKHAEQCPHCLCSDNDSKATEPQQIFVDNQGAIQLAKNRKFHERTKHISVRFHFVRDACEWNAIKTTSLPTSDMLADIMTKKLPRDTHWKHAHGLGLVSRDSGEVVDRPRVKRLK